MNKVIEENTISKENVRLVLEVLQEQGYEIRNRNSSFKVTEQALYLYPKIKEAINKNKEEIKYLEKYGLPNKSKDITTMASGLLMSDKQELIENKINKITQANVINYSYIEKINNVVGTLRNNKYYDIIRLRYFEGKTIEELCEYFEVSDTTIKKAKNKLINEIRVLLFPNNVINELGY